MPLLKLQHAHVSIYQELFIVCNSEVGQSRPRGLSRHSGRAQSTPRRAPPAPMAAALSAAPPTQRSPGHAGDPLGIISRAPHSLCVGGSLPHFLEEV